MLKSIFSVYGMLSGSPIRSNDEGISKIALAISINNRRIGGILDRNGKIACKTNFAIRIEVFSIQDHGRSNRDVIRGNLQREFMSLSLDTTSTCGNYSKNTAKDKKDK